MEEKFRDDFHPVDTRIDSKEQHRVRLQAAKLGAEYSTKHRYRTGRCASLGEKTLLVGGLENDKRRLLPGDVSWCCTVTLTVGGRQNVMPNSVTRKDNSLEGKSEIGVIHCRVMDVRVYSAWVSIGSGRVAFGLPNSRPRPAALSDSSIVYAGSFNCFSRRLWTLVLQCDLRAWSVSKYL